MQYIFFILDPEDDNVRDIETTDTQIDCLPEQETDQGSNNNVNATHEISKEYLENNNKLCCKCCKHRFFDLLFSMVFKLINGWKTYISYDVSWAGLGLALLYMTVLGFDNITTGKYLSFFFFF